MSKVIVIAGAGMMGSALSVPARDNWHEERIVGTHMDREIISHARQLNYHLTMKRRLPEGIAGLLHEEEPQPLHWKAFETEHG